MTSRNNPGVAFWATVLVVVVLMAYPLSFGPACWLVRRELLSPVVAAHFYRPLISFDRLPSWISQAVCWYGGTTDEGEITAATLANVFWFEELEASQE